MHWIVYIRSGDADWRQHFFSPSWYFEDRVVLQGNLLQQLTPEEQLGVFKGLMKDSTPTQTKSFCLSKMSTEQFEEVIKEEPLNVFIALFNWPLHLQFQEMTDRFFLLLSKKDFLCFLFDVILEKMELNSMDSDYVYLLNELWNKCPDNFKKYMDNSGVSNILKNTLKHVNNK
ncbi:hypothetical protein NPIL_139941 [Nephila pilipes]|uniref:Uncharacterized protein n=1 Tax=Nephila pilipes TaxID=299642 RepID=A0A8X6TP13_NEPPI|nr:hypothetical protein NPIL_139941 [Nephila pilipes]